MITPINNHILIEPVKHESFIASEKGTYEEIGVVIAVPWSEEPTPIGDTGIARLPLAKKGDKVYFDSWLAAKYPKNEKEFYWLVRWEDVRAIEHDEIPK